MAELLEPKELKITTQGGAEKVYIISKIPYMSGGREICTQFVTTALPKAGDYKLNEALSRKMFSFVAVRVDGADIRMTTDDLINNHVPDFQTGIRLEKEMLEYNFGFFEQEKISAFLKAAATKAQAWLMPILSQLQQQSLKKDGQHSTN